MTTIDVGYSDEGFVVLTVDGKAIPLLLHESQNISRSMLQAEQIVQSMRPATPRIVLPPDLPRPKP